MKHLKSDEIDDNTNKHQPENPNQIATSNDGRLPKYVIDENYAKKKWIKVSNVFKGINLLKRNIVSPIEDPDELISHINNSPRKKKSNLVSLTSTLNLTRQALDDHRISEKLFELVAKGGKNDII